MRTAAISKDRCDSTETHLVVARTPAEDTVGPASAKMGI